MEWMFLPYRRYFEFSGRSRRMEYWMFMVFNVGIMAVLAVAMLAIMFAIGTNHPVPGTNSAQALTQSFANGSGAAIGAAAALLGLFWLVTIIPSVAVTIRRLHDREVSGWWYLAYLLTSWIPLFGSITTLVLIVFLFLDGTPGSNRYGPDPKGRGLAEVFY